MVLFVLQLTDADQELYRNFPLVVSERWQQEVAETVFDAINQDTDKLEQKRKSKPSKIDDLDLGTRKRVKICCLPCPCRRRVSPQLDDSMVDVSKLVAKGCLVISSRDLAGGDRNFFTVPSPRGHSSRHKSLEKALSIRQLSIAPKTCKLSSTSPNHSHSTPALSHLSSSPADGKEEKPRQRKSSKSSRQEKGDKKSPKTEKTERKLSKPGKGDKKARKEEKRRAKEDDPVVVLLS